MHAMQAKRIVFFKIMHVEFKEANLALMLAHADHLGVLSVNKYSVPAPPCHAKATECVEAILMPDTCCERVKGSKSTELSWETCIPTTHTRHTLTHTPIPSV